MELHCLAIPVMLLHLPTGLSEEVLPLMYCGSREGFLAGAWKTPVLVPSGGTLTSQRQIGYLSCCMGCNRRLWSFLISTEKPES